MIFAVFLVAPNDVKTERVDEAPELLERDGVLFSLRGGPRQPQTTDRVWDPVAGMHPTSLAKRSFRICSSATGRMCRS